MVDFDGIQNTLACIEQKYTEYMGNVEMSILLSKMALIEFCGWLETSIDTILTEYINSLELSDDVKTVAQIIIKKTHGFHYENKILPLLCSVLGIYNVNHIINNISAQNIEDLKSITRNYSEKRNKATHTNVGIQITFDAPSQINHDLNRIIATIRTIEKEVQTLSQNNSTLPPS